MNWTDARAFCQATAPYNGDLASVPDQATNDFLTTLTTERVLIGGSDFASEGNWVWSDGTLWDYESWSPGNPSNGWGVEHYLEINYKGNGLWNDLMGNSTSGFICKVSELNNSDVRGFHWSS